MEKEPASLSQRVLSALLSVLLATQPLLPAVAATLTPTGNTQLDHAANGAPVVNIAPPNAAGISHNTYQDYNVGKEGLILNNATGKVNQTQLGGIIQGNPNLTAGREAAGIINEVTGTNRSQLQGYTEVAGKAANVMVANPYGITCNGCGFINTPNATLTTGKPVLDASGRLQSLDVSKGSILIEGQGMDASQSDAVSIIARATEVNAQLHAKSLAVVAGANRVAADGSISAIAGEGPAPKVAVDTGALGGMYANRIRLVASEKGVGVNLGNLNAREGDISLDVSGKLTLKNSLVSGALVASGESIELSGDHKAGGGLAMHSQGDLALDNSTLLSDKNLQLTASGRLVQRGGKLTAGQTLALTGGDIELNSQASVDAAGDIALTARNSAITQGAITAGKQLSVTGDTVVNDGQWRAGESARVKASRFVNNAAVIADGALTIEVDTLQQNGVLNAADDLNLTGKTLNTQAGSQTQTRGNLVMRADTLGLNGTHAAKGALDVTATEQLTHSGNSTAASMVLVSPLLANRGVLLSPVLALRSQQITNSGLIEGNHSLSLIAQLLDNQQSGMIYSAVELALALPTVTNSGVITSDAGLTITGNALTNSGEISARQLQLTHNSVNNLALGLVLAQDSASLSVAGELSNQGQLLSAGELSVSASRLDNIGLIQGDGDSLLRVSGQLDNAGQLLSGGTMTVATPEFINTGWWQADRLELNAISAVNSGTWLASGRADLSGSTFTNTGKVQGTDLLVNYNILNNNGTLLGSSALVIKADEVEQQQDGALFSAGDMLVNATGFTSLGQVVALGNITLNLVNAFSNTTTLAAGKTLAITSQRAITNQGVMQGDAVDLLASGELTNSGRITTGNGESRFSGGRLLFSEEGSLQGGGDITLNSLSDVTVAGFIGTAGSLTVNAAGTLLNTALLYAASNMQLFAEHIHNLYGDILAGNNLWMQRNAEGAANTEVVNTSGNIETQQGDITINTGYLLNERDGLSVAEAAFEYYPSLKSTLDYNILDVPREWLGYYTYVIIKGGINSHDYDYVDFVLAGNDEKEVLVSQETVVASANGTAARIASGGDLFVNVSVFDNKASDVLANGNMKLTGGSLNNYSVQTSSTSLYATYKYECKNNEVYCDNLDRLTFDLTDRDIKNLIDWDYSSTKIDKYNFTYTLQPDLKEVTESEPSSLFQAVIQAGGKITASFASDISNTLVTANADGFASAIATPTLNTFSTQTIASDEQAQALGNIKDGANTRDYPMPSDSNGYFITSTDPDSPYLITVNPKLNGLGQLDASLYGDLYALLGMQPGSAPRETHGAYNDRNAYLGSSYFLDKLGLKPERDYRFLGDAAFDTRYVSNTVLNQTGTRYINGLGSDLDQMRYLMDSAAAQQQTLGLQFGVALTVAQIAALDKSLLWWESATINGQTVMIPKVYLSPKDVAMQNGSVISGSNVQLAGGSVTNRGSTIAANNGLSIDIINSLSNLNGGLITAGGGLNLSALGDINNIGSSISGKTVGLESIGGSINNITRAQQWEVNASGREGRLQLAGTDVGQTATITATDSLAMRAGQDINVTGASVAAGGGLGMAAGNDINITVNEISESRSRSGFGRPTTQSSSTTQQRSNLTAGDDLTLLAGNDLNARAAGIAAEGDVGIRAGRDVNLLAEATSESASSKAKKKTAIDASVRQQGTEIASGGNAVVIAGRDMNAQAAEVTAQGDIGVAAGRDVNLTTATESDYRYRETTKTKSGFLSKKTTHTIEEDSATREKGSLLSGDSVTVQAGNNLLVKGSAIAGDGDVALSAGNNVDIVAATNTDTSWRFKETKKSGLMGTGGIGFTIGSSKSTHDLREQGTTQSGSFSTVGSTGGDVSIMAGKQAHIGGADIIAQKDITLTGDSVVIAPGHDKRTRDEKFEQKSSGLTVALSGAAGSAVNSAVTTAKSAKQSSDSRLAVLQGTQAALSGVQAGQALALDQAKGTSDKANNNTFGVSASLGSQSSKSSSHIESETTASSTLNAGSNVIISATGSDITVAGSQIKAGQDVRLDAARDVNLIASQDTQQTTGNSSSSGSLGVGVGTGSGGSGISISASANSSKGHEQGNGVWQNETTVDAGNRVTINTGRDATLTGAQVNGDSVTADIGRDLTIASTQDSDHYDSKQSSVSGGAGYTFGAGGFSGSINASRDKMTSDYDSVQEQSGIIAGKGGFDITVGNHTQLDGGVIASMAEAGRNSLDTGTLGFSDIHNQADFKTEHQGAGISTGGSIGGQFAGNMANGLLAGGGNSGHAQGTTQAAVSEGTLTVRDTANQQQDVATLSRDAEHAKGSISPIFDKEKEQRRLQEVQLIGAIGSQAADIVRTEGEIKGLNAARDELANKGKHEPDADASDQAKTDYQKALRETDAYKNTTSQYGTGSDLQRGIQAATAALQGLAGSDIAGALTGATAPELAHLLKSTQDNTAVNAIAHAILGGAVAALQGNSVAAGAAGAATGELAAKAIVGMLYPDMTELSMLSEEQKQTVSALATISAGLAGGLAGDSTGSAVAGGQAGKNAVENNSLSFGTGLDSYANAAASWNQYAVDKNLTAEQTQAGLNKLAKGDLPEGANITKAIVEGYQDGVFMAGAIYLGPTVAVGKGITGAVIGGGANSAFQYMSMSPESEFSYYSAAVAAGAGYLAPGYNIKGNALINMGGAFMTDGPSLTGQGGAIAGSLAGGYFGKYAPDLLAPYAGNASGFIGDIGGSFTFEYFNQKMKDSMEKE